MPFGFLREQERLEDEPALMQTESRQYAAVASPAIGLIAVPAVSRVVEVSIRRHFNA